jgi:hypothetical protein
MDAVSEEREKKRLCSAQRACYLYRVWTATGDFFFSTFEFVVAICTLSNLQAVLLSLSANNCSERAEAELGGK